MVGKSLEKTEYKQLITPFPNIPFNQKLHIYLRVSSEIQSKDGNSLKLQLEKGIEKFNQLKNDGLIKGYEVYDEGVFSSKDDGIEGRKELVRLMKGVEEGEVKYVFVYEVDRLSRNNFSWGIIRNKFELNSVKLYTPYQIINLKNKTDSLFLGIMKEFSVYDNKLRKERSVDGKLLRVKEGYWKGGKVNFGFKSIDKKLVVDEFESGWVKKMFKMYDEGKSVLDIKNELELKGIEINRGKSDWNLNSIRNILKNTIYIGYWIFKDKNSGEEVKCRNPKIIDRDLFDRVSKKVKRRDKKLQSNSTKHFYLLRDLMECSCGRIIKGRKKVGKNKDGKRLDEGFYYCDNRMEVWREGKIGEEEKYKRGKFCSNQKSMNIKKTDNIVWMVLLNIVSKSYQLKEDYKKELVSKIEEIRDEGKKNKKNFERRIGKLEDEERRLSNLISNLKTNKLVDGVGDDVDRIINNMENKRKEVSDKVEEENRLFNNLVIEKKWVNWLNKFNEELMNKEGLKDKEKKEYIEKLVENIKISFNPSTQSHNLKFKFKLPIINDMRVREGGKYIIKDGDDILDLDGVELYGRVYDNKDEKKKMKEIIERSIPTKQTQSVTVE